MTITRRDYWLTVCLLTVLWLGYLAFPRYTHEKSLDGSASDGQRVRVEFWRDRWTGDRGFEIISTQKPSERSRP